MKKEYCSPVFAEPVKQNPYYLVYANKHAIIFDTEDKADSAIETLKKFGISANKLIETWHYFKIPDLKLLK